MSFNYAILMANPYFLIFVSMFIGLLVGRLRIGRNFRLGMSGCMFVGLAVGWLAQAVVPNSHSSIVPNDFFYPFLVLFISSVGVQAARGLGPVIRQFGVKFAILGFVITFAGAASAYFAAKLLSFSDSLALTGVYTGALTSSPGLGTALELAGSYGARANAVGPSYAAAYPFGIAAVLGGVHLIPWLFGVNMDKEKRRYRVEVGKRQKKSMAIRKREASFDLGGLVLIVVVGYLIGTLKVDLGSLGSHGLGAAGGVLLAALILGSIGRIGPIHFYMESKGLGAARDISLAFFLSIVGLRNGFGMVNALMNGGLSLVIIAVVSAFSAMLVGFIVGYYVFHINWVLLAGALCGGMTSTPGLGAAVDAVGSDDPAAGYGATYPFALLGMVLFTAVLHVLPL